MISVPRFLSLFAGLLFILLGCKKDAGRTVDLNSASANTVQQKLQGHWRLTNACGGFSGGCMSITPQNAVYNLTISGDSAVWSSVDSVTAGRRFFIKKGFTGTDSLFAMITVPDSTQTFILGIQKGKLSFGSFQPESYGFEYQLQ